jgi:Phospholipase_D-nuclease N-terminal
VIDAQQAGSAADRSVSINRSGGVQHMFDDNGSFVVAMFEVTIFIAFLMCLWWIFGDLFRSRDLSGLLKTLWVLLIIVLPILGALLYLLMRGNGMTAREIEYYKAKGLT